MAVQHGMPGEWAKVRGTVLSLWPLLLSSTALGAFATALVLGRCAPLFGALLVVTLVFMAVFWRKGLRRIEPFFKGARGEEWTAQVLSALPDEWHVFHDFEAGHAHVDHVVVGPTGVYSVETKTWNGSVTVEENEVLVNGRLPSRPPIAQALSEAKDVRSALEKTGWTGEAVPVVCFASNTYAESCSAVKGVTLVNANALVGWILTRPQAIAPNELGRLVQLMETGV